MRRFRPESEAAIFDVLSKIPVLSPYIYYHLFNGERTSVKLPAVEGVFGGGSNGYQVIYCSRFFDVGIGASVPWWCPGRREARR